MAKQDKIIAGIVLLHSTLGILWTFRAASQAGFPIGFISENLVLAAVGIAAGVGRLRGKSAYLAMTFYLAQLLHLVTPTFQWTFTLGFNFNLTFGWFGEGELGINLVALAMLWWIGARAFALHSSSRGKPLSQNPA